MTKQASIKPLSQKRGRYKSGIEREKKIIDVAVELLIGQGYQDFSFRKVAQSSGISVGNLQHYYPSKADLVKAMLGSVLDKYMEQFSQVVESDLSPKQQFHDLLAQVIRDLNNKQTTMFFPELWSMANHDDMVEVEMERMYARYREVLAILVARVNPKLSEVQVEKAALFISASIEGLTLFIGYKKKWNALTEDIVDMSYNSFLRMIESGDIPK